MNLFSVATSLTSSEWASWVQAAGGVVQAIGALIALYIAIHLQRRDRKDAREESTHRASEGTKLFVFQALSYITTVQVEGHDRGKLLRLISLGEETLRFGQAVDLQDLPTMVAWQHTEIAAGVSGTLAHLRHTLNVLKPDAIAALAVVDEIRSQVLADAALLAEELKDEVFTKKLGLTAALDSRAVRS